MDKVGLSPSQITVQFYLTRSKPLQMLHHKHIIWFGALLSFTLLTDGSHICDLVGEMENTSA